MFNNTSDGCRVLCQSEAFLCSPVLVRGKGDISVLNPQSDPSSVSFLWISWHCRLCLLLLGFSSTEAFFGGFSLWGPLGLSAALAAPALSRETMDCDLQRPLSTVCAFRALWRGIVTSLCSVFLCSMLSWQWWEHMYCSNGNPKHKNKGKYTGGKKLIYFRWFHFCIRLQNCASFHLV